MRWARRLSVVAFLTTMLWAGWPRFAQAQAPRIGYVYPAGARQGTLVQITAGGQYLDGATNVYISGTGVTGAVVEVNKPMPMGLFNMLRDKFQELQQRKQAALRDGSRRTSTPPAGTNTWTATDEKTLAETRERLLKNPPNRQATPALAETVQIELSLAADAEPGEREIRLGTSNGLTNPRAFHVGVLPELSKPHSTPPNPAVDRFRQRMARGPALPQTNVEVQVSLPAVLNGQILPGGVDRYRFKARHGQRLVFVASARELIPYLADAVPGWFQATLTVWDSEGRELAYCDDFRFNPDPALCFEVPKTGEYTLALKDAIYRGREDFVYRITAGELPFVTSVFPLGGRAGETTQMTLSGWNLPVTQLAHTNVGRGLQSVSVRSGPHRSNRVPFAVDSLPECVEDEPNNSPADPQEITLPVIANGRIDPAGERDCFRFKGKAGDQVVAEVRARRLNSPLDSLVELRTASGALVAANDDFSDKSAGLATHHADSYLAATLPSDGEYVVCLSDTQRQGGPDHAYRLRLSPPVPDFELRVAPSTLNVRAGAIVPLTVHALRKDGFKGDIVLRLGGEDLGFKLAGGRIPAGQDQVRVTLALPTTPLDRPVNLVVEGIAIAQGRPLARQAVPADDMMQAFAYQHLVPAQELKVVRTGRAAPRAPLLSLGPSPLKIPIGGTARARLEGTGRRPVAGFRLELDEPPPGLSMEDAAGSGGSRVIELRCDKDKTQAGLRGNLIVRILAAGNPTGRRPQAGPRRPAIGYLPAVPFEIIGAEAP